MKYLLIILTILTISCTNKEHHIVYVTYLDGSIGIIKYNGTEPKLDTRACLISDYPYTVHTCGVIGFKEFKKH